jgi:hypothetical protein
MTSQPASTSAFIASEMRPASFSEPGYPIQPPRGATQCVRVRIWSASRSKRPSRDRRARYRSIFRFPGTDRTVQVLGRCGGRPQHSSGPGPRGRRAGQLDLVKNEFSTRRINSATAYAETNLDFPAMAAGRHGDHPPASVEHCRNCRRGEADDCKSGQQCEAAHAIANHGSPHMRVSCPSIRAVLMVRPVE